MITIEVQDAGLRATLQKLAERIDNPRPVLQAIGEDIMERTKRRFETSTGPDGQRWQPNALATILALIERTTSSYAAFSHVGSKKQGVTRTGNKAGMFLKDGKTLSKKARATLAGKRVLIDTGDLSRQFSVRADRNGVTIGNSMVYAAIHQFGGQAGKGKKVTIPARPFLPVTREGGLYPQERALILEQINDWLAGK